MAVSKVVPTSPSVKIEETLEIPWDRIWSGIKDSVSLMNFANHISRIWNWLDRKRNALSNRGEAQDQISIIAGRHAFERIHGNLFFHGNIALPSAKTAYYLASEIHKSLSTYDEVISILSRIPPERAEAMVSLAFGSAINCNNFTDQAEEKKNWEIARVSTVELWSLIDGNDLRSKDYYVLADHCFELGDSFSRRIKHLLKLDDIFLTKIV